MLHISHHLPTARLLIPPQATSRSADTLFLFRTSWASAQARGQSLLASKFLQVAALAIALLALWLLMGVFFLRRALTLSKNHSPDSMRSAHDRFGAITFFALGVLFIGLTSVGILAVLISLVTSSVGP